MTTIWVGTTGEWAYPCWCGVTHAGPDGLCDWARHNCLHGLDLLPLGDPADGMVICLECGQTWHITAANK